MTNQAPLEPAYVLHRRAYRETSLLIELLSPSRGRVGVVARGARGPKSRWRGTLEPFQSLFVSLGGRGELATLRRAEPAGRRLTLPAERLASAFYVNELIMRLLRRNDPAAEVFAAYAEVVGGLVDSTRDEAQLLRCFELQLLRLLGYGLSLEQTALGQPVDPAAWYRYRPEVGLEAATGNAADVCRGDAVLALIAGDPVDPGLYRQARRITAAALAPLLGHRPLESRRLQRSRPSTAAGNDTP
ncbi:DNA repair protein RecO [Natronocella acetinitrilica]|uniref:DNA repair protein RecO n=1 Tax=Natronocella acetinitrilica TaxID=414046 RepID=UPI002646F8BC|nr:DNA repair protein RecO [Natronocella acetinitrilica]